MIHEPWMTVQLLKYNKKTRHLCKKAKETGDPADYVKYKQYRKTLNRLKTFEKRNFYSTVFQKIGKNAKMLWEVLNHVMKKVSNKMEILSVITREGKIVDPKSVVNVFNEHFVNVGKRTQNSIVHTDFDPLENICVNPNNLLLKPLTESKLCSLVAKMEPKCSCGSIGKYLCES